jgi:hypothetical protein
VQVDYSSARDREIIKGLATYNILQNPKWVRLLCWSALTRQYILNPCNAHPSFTGTKKHSLSLPSLLPPITKWGKTRHNLIVLHASCSRCIGF